MTYLVKTGSIVFSLQVEVSKEVLEQNFPTLTHLELQEVLDNVHTGFGQGIESLARLLIAAEALRISSNDALQERH